MATRPVKETDRYEFVVRGKGDLPYDMLRYDCCWPMRQEDVHAAMIETRDEGVTIRLRGVRAPTVERWHSMGWQVLESWFVHPTGARRRDI